MRIVAFDLSLTSPAVCADGRLDTLPTGKLRGHQRLDTILDWIVRHVTADGCDRREDLIAIEGYSYGAKGRAFISLAELGGIVRHELHTIGFTYIEIPPACVKKYATGKGNAGKDDVLAAAIRRGGALFTGITNDEADAFWIWALTCDLIGQPTVGVPKQHREALDKLELPDLGEAA